MITLNSRLTKHTPKATVSAIITLLLVITLGMLTAPSKTMAQAKVGTTGAQFLELGVSAKAMGMAEAFVAHVSDVSAIYYNPAGLTSLYGREVLATYVDMPAGIQYGFVAFGMPMESIGGVLGIGISGLTSGDMVEMTYNNGVGDGTGRTFAWNDIAISMSYGRYLTDRFSLGFTVKYIGSDVHDYSASSWSADVGTNYDTGYRGFKLAMAISNFGPDLEFIEKAAPLPINFRFGSTINLIESVDHVLTFAAEGSHPSDNLEKYNSGLEYTFKERYILRFGSRFNYDSDGITAGGGIRVPYGEDGVISIDYAYQDFGILTDIHRFTLGFAF